MLAFLRKYALHIVYIAAIVVLLCFIWRKQSIAKDSEILPLVQQELEATLPTFETEFRTALKANKRRASFPETFAYLEKVANLDKGQRAILGYIDSLEQDFLQKVGTEGESVQAFWSSAKRLSALQQQVSSFLSAMEKELWAFEAMEDNIYLDSARVRRFLRSSYSWKDTSVQAVGEQLHPAIAFLSEITSMEAARVLLANLRSKVLRHWSSQLFLLLKCRPQGFMGGPYFMPFLIAERTAWRAGEFYKAKLGIGYTFYSHKWGAFFMDGDSLKRNKLRMPIRRVGTQYQEVQARFWSRTKDEMVTLTKEIPFWGVLPHLNLRPAKARQLFMGKPDTFELYYPDLESIRLRGENLSVQRLSSNRVVLEGLAPGAAQLFIRAEELYPQRLNFEVLPK